MVKPYIPDRGDIVWLDFSPHMGHEQAGTRPALIISGYDYNHHSGLMLACPITSKVKGYPFEARIQTKKIDGSVLADQVKSLDWEARRPVFGERAPAETLEVTQRLLEKLVRG